MLVFFLIEIPLRQVEYLKVIAIYFICNSTATSIPNIHSGKRYYECILKWICFNII